MPPSKKTEESWFSWAFATEVKHVWEDDCDSSLSSHWLDVTHAVPESGNRIIARLSGGQRWPLICPAVNAHTPSQRCNCICRFIFQATAFSALWYLMFTQFSVFFIFSLSLTHRNSLPSYLLHTIWFLLLLFPWLSPSYSSSSYRAL